MQSHCITSTIISVRLRFMPTTQPLDKDTIRTIIVSMSVIYGLLVVAIAVMGSFAFWRTPGGAPKSFRMLFVMAAPIATVALVVLAGVFLAITDRLTEGAIGLFSGVAAYILGSAKADSKQASEE